MNTSHHHHHIPQTFEPVIATLESSEPATETEKLLAVSRIQNMLEYAMTHENATCLWIGLNYHAVRQAWRDVVYAATKEHDEIIHRIEQGSTALTLKNGSKLLFKSIVHPEYMRGYILHWVGFSIDIVGSIREEV